MSLQLEFHDEATEELYAAAAWYDEQEAGLGEEFVEEVDSAVDAIVANPDAWPLIRARRRTFRQFILPRFPYVLPYWQTETTITVVAVAHTSRLQGYWAKRRP